MDIRKTDIKIDLDRLLTDYKKILQFNPYEIHSNQISFTHRPDCIYERYDGIGSLWSFEDNDWHTNEREFTEFNDKLKDTYFYELYQSLPYDIARMRLMNMAQRKCLKMHHDETNRLHIALITNPYSYLMFYENNDMYQIPVDGHLYEMEATKVHTAFNSGFSDRIHLVMSLKD